MDKEKVKKRKKAKPTKHITIRVSKRVCEWMKENNYSPTGIFVEAVKELGYKK